MHSLVSDLPSAEDVHYYFASNFELDCYFKTLPIYTDHALKYTRTGQPISPDQGDTSALAPMSNLRPSPMHTDTGAYARFSTTRATHGRRRRCLHTRFAILSRDAGRLDAPASQTTCQPSALLLARQDRLATSRCMFPAIRVRGSANGPELSR